MYVVPNKLLTHNSMADYRKKTIIDISGSYLGCRIDEDAWNSNVVNIDALEDFLENESNAVLYVSLDGKAEDKYLKFVNDISADNERVVVFYKCKQISLTNENLLQSIFITSLHGSATSALYHVLQRVFTPLINKSDKKATNTYNIEKHLSNLQAGLRSSLLSTESLDDTAAADDDSISVVLSIDQELEYWHNITNTTKSKELRGSSSAFRDILLPLSRDFSVLDALPITDVEDILESAHNVLDDLWRHEPPYPRNRIEHLMEIIASDISIYISNQLKDVNIWTEDYNSATELLEICIVIGKRWISSCKELTEIFWPNYSLHLWRGEPFVPTNLTNLVNKLKDILNIRTLHKQLTRLLKMNEQEDLKTDEMFKPFKDLNILQYGTYAEQPWIMATKKFEYLLQPAEQCVAKKLKTQLNDVKSNTRQLLHEYGRYSELICRPVLKSVLQNERQYLISVLQDYTRTLSGQMSETPTISTKYETPQVVVEILATRQLESKALNVQTISSKLLDDLKGYEELKQNVNELIKDLKAQHTELYDSWTSEIISQINSKTLSLCEQEAVVQFSTDKLMKVNYSPRLVTLISEVRQLTAMGYNIPDIIVQTSLHAKQFMKFAKFLEQIANFHNTIGDRMIPSLRPLMLSSALELSRLVQEQEVVSWGDIQSVEKYVNSLKTAVDKLSQENNLLTSYHYQIIDKINQLNTVDLIKYYDKWKQSAKSMRDIMNQVHMKGFKNLQTWKVDLDKHLCKVLESQYIKSLDTVHLYLPEIYAELIYRDSSLLFSPDKVALKEKYEQQMKRFLEIPRSFRGISDNAEGNAFSEIMNSCKDKLAKVDSNTDDLFEQLEGVKKHWSTWLSLGNLDTSQLITWEHWDLHFRSSKTFGQEIAKLPSTEERVGCFIIGLSRLRSDLESHNRSYWDQLISTLKDSIIQDVVKLQQYVDISTATLNRQPLTLEQIGDADASHSNIIMQRPEMEKIHQEMARKVQVLASWTRERIDSVNRLQGGWERLQNLLENYQHIIAKQIETVKTTLNVAAENLNNEIERFAAKWEQVKPRPNSGQIATESLSQLHQHLENIKEKKELWKELKGQKDKLISDCEKFTVDVPSFELFEDVEKDLDNEEATWMLFEEFYKDLETLYNEEWIVFRKKVYKLDDFLSEWQTKLQNMETSQLVTRLLQEIHKYQAAAPALKYLRGEDFTEKHWLETFTLLDIPPKTLDNLCLKDFLDKSEILADNQTGLQAICKKAASEVIVRQALAELDQWDVQAHFQLNSHTDSQKKELLLIKEFKEILNKIGDNQSLLQSVKNSSDYESFSERASVWESRLTDLDHYLTSLSQIQRKWVYLEPIFGGGTLGQEKARFDKLDRDFRHLMKFIERDTRVCALLRFPNLRSLMENLSDQLSRCQKSLDEFLAEKRNKFPRFLFLGDDDLLEVVGQSSKEQVIQTHLKKLFAGIHSIVLDSDGKRITAMKSLQGETVELGRSVNIDQPVEDWLNNLVNEMQKTLQELLVSCLGQGKSPDPLKYPSQILCLADSIQFTSQCEQAISSTSLSQLLTSYKSQLTHYSSLDLNESGDYNKDDEESNILEIKLKALLLDTIHHIRVIEDLIDTNVSKVTDWNWQKQLRFYSTSSGEVTIKMVNAVMEYAYEYIGNIQKLVQTPLTDKCYLTLTQAMHLGMGGNPYGPAGTGKTESVKALGSLLGRQVLVFNCDEGIDAASMGRILSGLVRCGAWGCFDEFNRLDEATLSAISMHIQPIQNALKLQKSTVTLLNQEIQLNKHCGIFVTLNPAGAGYGGRNKLPDNLKQLFRPVVMTHPDHEQIARTLLHCDGYKYAGRIGRKLIELFQMASKLLSKQQHYDWGLRALRTVLNGCGRAVKEYRKTHPGEEVSQQVEFNLVVQAIRTDTLSKLTFSDSRAFDGLVKDMFSGVEFLEPGEAGILKALEESFAELGFNKNIRQINKCIEMYEQLKQRMGIAIVGPPSSGKSTIRNILFHSLVKMDKTIKQHVFNPKSMPRTQLLGQIDNDTRQWTDGVLTQCSLQVTNESLDVWSCIVCDGDIDPEWVESLNSVMDDNRLLSLPSGWRVQFGPNVNFIFETDDLSFASPATISRMGIVFLSEEDIDLNDYVNNFIQTQVSEDVARTLQNYINDYLYRAIDWVINEAELVIQTSKIALTKTVLSQIRNASSKNAFIVGLLNGLGGQMDQDFREVFAQQVFEWTGENPPSIPPRAQYLADRDMIDSYYTKPNQTIQLVNNEIPLVPTAQVSQSVDSIKIWLSPGSEEHFIAVGPHGSAKTLIIESLAADRSDCDLATVHCSANITPQYVIYKIIQYCIAVNSNKGRVYKPKKGHLILYFKNMHLLKGDKWGTNMLLAFLQQLIVYNGFFDNNLEWVQIQNITIVGSLAPTNKLPKRFTSLVHVYNVELPEQEDSNVIFTAYLCAILKQCMPNNSSWSKAKVNKLVSTMLLIYNQIKETFTQTDQQHYVFSPHDLTKWCKGTLRYKLQTNDVETFLLEVICYEGMRIFLDRLVGDEDKDKLKAIVNHVIYNEWAKNNILQNLMETYYVANSQFSTNKSFVSLTKLNTEDWKTIVLKGIIQYEREGYQLNVQVIQEILQLTADLSRALTMPGGNVLLVGNAGVGRRSAVKIVSALESAKLMQCSSPNDFQFKNDFKLGMQYAGLDGDQVYLLLEDHVLCKNSVMNIVNIFLSSGEVPGLYNAAELESLIFGLKDEAGRLNFDGNLYELFVDRARTKLHIIACLETENESFWKILENCPALVQKCSMVWLNHWCKTSMESIPKMLIKKASDKEDKDTTSVEISNKFELIQSSLDKKLATPIRFVNLIKTYSEIYIEKKKSIIDKRIKLEAGVSKLTEARNVVADLKLKAAEQQEQLSEKQSKANKALDMISNTMKNANVHKEEMETLKKKTEQENNQLMKRKREIEEELSEVEPLIQEARMAVGNIKPESLSEIRSLRAPPEIIRDILEGVLRLMGTQDTSWNSMKTFLAKRGVREDIRSFDATRITSENRIAVEKLIQNKSESFDPKSSKRASVAAAPLAAWVRANVRYAKVVEKIRPLEKEQHRLQENLSEAESQLTDLSAGLLDVDAAVAKLKNQLSTYTREAAEIEIKLSAAQETLASAEGLVGKLIDEYERWQRQLKDLENELQVLPVYCLLSSAFITYLSREPEDVRKQILDEWIQKISETVEFSFEEFMSTEREQLQWQSEGLSTDQLSIQNAIIILKSKFCPFLIDPTSMAINWLKARFKDKNFEAITQDSSKFNTSLELAVRFGKTLLIEEVESVSPIIFGLLRKQFIFQGERVLINLNGKLIDYHKDFQLLLSSRNAYLNLPADVASYLNEINFTITRAGLTEQLLISAIRQESPELEERRKELLRQREELQEKQHDLQNQLLEDLANSTGDILQNKNLLTSLNETKASSNAITSALVESSQIQSKLRQEYEVYKEIASFGSTLYFAAVEFMKINVLYLISVSAYTELFLKSLPSIEGLQNTENYTHKILIQSLYQYMGRGIFKDDRIKFLLHLVHRMFPDQIPEDEWNFFIGNIIGINRSESTLDKNSLAWLPEQTLPHIVLLQSSLPNLFNTLQLSDSNLWKPFMETSNCETNFPKLQKWTEFQKVLIIQVLRGDRLYSSITHCVLHITGMKSLTLDVLQLSQIFKESLNTQPILLITSSGNDPSNEVRELAANIVNSDKYTEISMGEGQENKAISSLIDASQLGHWLILKNLHLVTSWLPVLCQHLQSLKPQGNFRLWLVTEAHANFSSVLAENSLKIAYEAPVGIRSNLYRIYTSYTSNYLQKLSPTASRVFFVLSCVHAVLQERRKYIPQGWSKWYEFSNIDLTTMIKLVEEIWQNSGSQVQWKYLAGWSLSAVYGGRIENIQDLSILEAYLKQYFVDEVLGHRWKPLGLNSTLPSTSNYQDYLNFISHIAYNDIPLYFGLPENVDRAWEKNFSREIVHSLKNLLLSKNMSLKHTKETWHKALFPFMNLWKKLNQGHDFIRMSVPTSDQKESSLASFLSEEYRNAIILMQKIHKSFSVLNRIARGQVMAEESDYDVANDLIILRTPNGWLKLWDGPKDPSKFLRDVVQKTITISKMVNNEISILQSPVNLSLIFNPETLLAAFKQDYSRKTNIPIDELELRTTWRHSENCIAMSGLLIEGALFDGMNLLPCSANSDNINAIPDCYVSWEAKKRISEHEKLLELPLYYTSNRKKQLTLLQIPCNNKEKNKWIQAGLACFLTY